MRKIFNIYLPVSILMVFLAMVLLTCGGCGGGGGISGEETQPAPPEPVTPLTGLSINGPSLISVYGTATYTATLTMSDGLTSMVTPSWSVNSSRVSISPDGELSCTGIDGDLTVTITATYSSGGTTETDSMNVTVTNNTWGFQNRGPRGLHFEEDIDADGGYHSYLYRFNTDSSFQRYSYENPPDASDLVTGSWSIDAEGKLILTLPGQGTITVTRLADPWIVSHVLVDDETGTPYNTTWEWTGPGPFPFDGSLIHGTYVNQYGDTWIFNANGTGSTTGDGGWTYTWSVEDGILKVIFPNGYVGWMYNRSTTMHYPTTIIRWAFVLNTPTGDFNFFYGGMNLIRQ
jgi:hypothetical protein